MNNIAAVRLYEAMRTTSADVAANVGTEAVSGVVTSINPIVIQVGNLPPLDESYLVLSAFCKEYKKNYITHYKSGNSPEEGPKDSEDHNHKIEIVHWRGLQVGDVVNMVRMSGNQRYQIIDWQGMTE